MFYRVDYLLAVMLVGLLLGLSMSRATAHVLSSRLASQYYVVTAIVTVSRAVLFAASILSQRHFLSLAGGVIGDVSALLFGALFGLAAVRKDKRVFITDKINISALCLSVAFTMSMASLGKALTLTSMEALFTQSGYASNFLRFIIMAEAFGALGLLLPWAMRPALIGLGIDMFGAITTHIHNNDPINDSTGAIGMLIRMIMIGVLLVLCQRTADSPRSVRRAIYTVLATMVVCLIVTIVAARQ